MRNKRHRTGDIGEAAFVLKATQLGLQVAKPMSGKEGYDYITHNGHTANRVQIKTTATRASKGAYHVSTARGARKLTPYKKNEIDYLVIYVLPEDTFYILPQKALAGRVALSVPSIHRKRPTKFSQHRERWDLLTTKPKPRSKSLTLHACAENNLELLVPTTNQNNDCHPDRSGGTCSCSKNPKTTGNPHPCGNLSSRHRSETCYASATSGPGPSPESRISVDRGVAMLSPKPSLAVLATVLLGSSSLLAICNNCEPDPSSPTYASTVHSRPALANTRGQDEHVGRFPHPIEHLVLGSTSYNREIPVLHLAGRNGLDLNLTLFYNSRVWTKDVNSSNKFTFNADRDWPAIGFRMGFGTLEIAPDDIHSYVFTEPDSAKHLFKLLSGTLHNSVDNTYMQYDSSVKVLTYKNGVKVAFEPFSIKNPTTGVWAPSTTLFRPIQIEDTNGNFITISYVVSSEQSISTVTDTLGRVINFGYDTSSNLSSITWNGQTWAFSWNPSYLPSTTTASEPTTHLQAGLPFQY